MDSPKVDQNTRMAAERTLLAWIRTGLSLMGFGFVVARFGMFLEGIDQGRGPQLTHSTTPWLGVLLVLVGSGTLVLATARHVRFIRSLEEGKTPSASTPIEMWASIALAGIGIVMATLLASSLS